MGSKWIKSIFKVNFIAEPDINLGLMVFCMKEGTTSNETKDGSAGVGC